MTFKHAVLLSTTLSFFLTACAGSRMQVKQFSQKTLSAKETLNGKKDFSKFVGIPILFRKGDTIPLNITVDNPYLGITIKKTVIRIRKHFFILYELSDRDTQMLRNKDIPVSRRKKLLNKLKIYFSNDKRNWAPITSHKDLKKVFGIRKGTVSFFLAVRKDTGIYAGLGLTGE